MRTCLVIISAPTSAHDMTPRDVAALIHHHLENQAAKTDMTLVLNRIVALALVAVQNRAARIVIVPAWNPWGVATAVITPKRARHVVTVAVVPNLDRKAMDLAEAECLVIHGDLDEVAPR